MVSSLVPDKPEPPGEGAELKTGELCAGVGGGMRGAAKEKASRTRRNWAELIFKHANTASVGPIRVRP